MLVGFFEAVCWALVVLANKRTLAYVNPLPLNFLVRLVSIVGQLALIVPFTVFGWWSLGFGMTPKAAAYIAVVGGRHVARRLQHRTTTPCAPDGRRSWRR